MVKKIIALSVIIIIGIFLVITFPHAKTVIIILLLIPFFVALIHPSGKR